MNFFRRLFSFATVASLLYLAASPAHTALGQMLPSSQTPAAVLEGRAVLLNHYEPKQMLRLAIVLTPPHPVEEQQFLEDVQNKQSPSFHQFLSADEWNVRFSPSAQDEQAVADWAASAGLKVTQRYPNRLVVDVEAPAGVIEKAFNVIINQYRLNAGDPLLERVAFSNDRDPQLPARLEGIVADVQGLNSVERMTPMIARTRQLPDPDYSPGPVKADSPVYVRDASGSAAPDSAVAHNNGPQVIPPPAGDRTPAFYWASSAYDYQALMNLGHCCNPLQNPDNSPPETSIAIAAYGDVAPADVTAFATQFSLQANFQKHFIDGGYSCNNAPQNPDTNCVETTIDTEWAIASANSLTTYVATAKVAVYEAPNSHVQSTTDMFNFMLSDGLARTMSTSFSCVEDSADNCRLSTLQGFDSILSQMAGQGWTLVAASGDRGATLGCSNSLLVGFPSSDPNVVAVGGTNLLQGSPAYEVAWTGATAPGSCSINAGGSTGGFSQYFLSPSYQQSFRFAKRAIPDVALDAAQPHAVYYNGGWLGLTGTSIATPMMAGFFAQENAYLLSLGNKCGSNGTAPCAPLGNANYPIYAEALHPTAAHYPFYDIVSGCNSNDITLLYQLNPYCAGLGYDEVTGWGSANMLQLAWSINWEIGAATGLPYITFKGPALQKWYNTNQIVSWTVNDYPGPNIAQSSAMGIAGFTQGWDGIGTDSYSQPNGGTNDLFYAGPQFPNGTGGCLSLAPGAGCSGGVPTGQGCHTVYVHGWNNQGGTTAGQPYYPETYGPVCYDSIPPVLGIVNSPNTNSSVWYSKPVTVTMLAYDPGDTPSGVKQIIYGVNSPCGLSKLKLSFCSGYFQPFTLSADGVYNIIAYAEDVAGNTTAQTDAVHIDTTPPVTNAIIIHEDQSVRITILASDATSGVEATFYQLDQGPVTDYTLPFSLYLAGRYTLTYWSVDYANNEGAHKTVAFTVP